eukprot:5390906-Pleurochrysis_carterae.AAC.2
MSDTCDAARGTKRQLAAVAEAAAGAGISEQRWEGTMSVKEQTAAMRVYTEDGAQLLRSMFFCGNVCGRGSAREGRARGFAATRLFLQANDRPVGLKMTGFF